MILVDSSVWIDHLRSRDDVLAALLEQEKVASHPYVIGEIALGRMRQRGPILHSLHRLPQALVARDSEVLAMIEGSSLFGLGIGYVDIHLLASAKLTAGMTLWTRDKRLMAAASALGVAASILD